MHEDSIRYVNHVLVRLVSIHLMSPGLLPERIAITLFLGKIARLHHVRVAALALCTLSLCASLFLVNSLTKYCFAAASY